MNQTKKESFICLCLRLPMWMFMRKSLGLIVVYSAACFQSLSSAWGRPRAVQPLYFTPCPISFHLSFLFTPPLSLSLANTPPFAFISLPIKLLTHCPIRWEPATFPKRSSLKHNVVMRRDGRRLLKWQSPGFMFSNATINAIVACYHGSGFISAESVLFFLPSLSQQIFKSQWAALISW